LNNRFKLLRLTCTRKLLLHDINRCLKKPVTQIKSFLHYLLRSSPMKTSVSLAVEDKCTISESKMIEEQISGILSLGQANPYLIINPFNLSWRINKLT
jgi:hypothetical protein